MCDPTLMAVASFAVGAAQAVSGYSAQQQQANAIQAMNATNAHNAEVARAQDQNIVTRRQTQEIDAASSKLFQSRIAAAKQTAAAEAVGESRGIAGNTLNAIVAEYMAQAGREDATTIRNNSMTVAELQAERTQANLRAQARSVPQPVSRPSLLGMGLEIAGAGASAYSDYRKYDRLRNDR